MYGIYLKLVGRKILMNLVEQHGEDSDKGNVAASKERGTNGKTVGEVVCSIGDQIQEPSNLKIPDVT
jgi:hypothetical protein